MKKCDLLTSFTTVAMFLLSALSASAHHSMMGYDLGHDSAMIGTIIQLDWTNPHVQLQFEAKTANGGIQKWMGEMPSPLRLENNGWNKSTLKAGDEVVIVGNLAKNGSATMRLVEVIFPDGKKLRAYGS